MHDFFNVWSNHAIPQFAVDVSDMPVTLKQGQGHKIWYASVDPSDF